MQKFLHDFIKNTSFHEEQSIHFLVGHEGDMNALIQEKLLLIFHLNN